jgi:quercetin dioxygenase-like cupin family protein
MSTKWFYVVIMILSAGAVSFAQDPTKVEASHYKLAFENASVQVVNVHYGPHEKSGIHDHPGGVVVVITGGHLRFTDQNGTVTEVFSKPGESRWFPPFRHKVENVGDTPYNAVYIGMKTKQTAGGTDPGNNSSGIGEQTNMQVDVQTKKLIAAFILASGAQ